jgi:hypothetical protein
VNVGLLYFVALRKYSSETCVEIVYKIYNSLDSLCDEFVMCDRKIWHVASFLSTILGASIFLHTDLYIPSLRSVNVAAVGELHIDSAASRSLQKC